MDDASRPEARSEAERIAVKQRNIQICISLVILVVGVVTLLTQEGVL